MATPLNLYIIIANFINAKTETTEFKISSRIQNLFKFAPHSANLSRSERQILLTGLQQIGFFALAGAADI